MARNIQYHPHQRIKVDGQPAVIIDVLSAQLFVEFDINDQQFILLSGGHKIEITNVP